MSAAGLTLVGGKGGIPFHPSRLSYRVVTCYRLAGQHLSNADSYLILTGVPMAVNGVYQFLTPSTLPLSFINQDTNNTALTQGAYNKACLHHRRQAYCQGIK